MDYTGIIQLIIATILYSTLVAPNINRMSELRSEISDMLFPLKSDKGYEKARIELGTAINKKMKQYGALYAETRKFLWFLYGAMAVALLSQALPVLYTLIHDHQLQMDKLVPLSITAMIFILLIIAMRIFIRKPEQIRTFGWLSSVGVALTYSHDIFKPSLEINQVASNIRESNNHVNISLASDIGLFGYSLILTIENVEGDKIYHVVAGRVQKEKYLKTSSNYYTSGQSRSLLELVHSLRLKPGDYKVRLLIFETVFPGKRNPTEVLGGFSVDKSTATANLVDIDLNSITSNYSFKSEKDSVRHIEFLDDFENGEGIRVLLSSVRFRRRFARAKALYSLGEINGMLTREFIESAFLLIRVQLQTYRMRVMRRYFRMKRRTTHIKLK